MGQPAHRRARTNYAVGYLRRSTDRQEQSIDDQRRAVEEYAVEHGLRLVDCYVDDAISGTSTTGRRAFNRMIADAQRPDRPFDIVVVYDVKRFGRVDNDEAGYFRHLLRLHGVSVRYTSEGFTGAGVDDLLRPVKQWQARQESKDLAKVTIRGLLSKLGQASANGHTSGEHGAADVDPNSGLRDGWWMGGCPPYGYDLRYESADGTFLWVLRYLPDGSKQLYDPQGELVRTLGRRESLNISKRDRARLTPSHPDRVAVVHRIFTMYAQQGKGLKAIADALNRENVPTARGPAWSRLYSGKWTTPTVRSILVNPLYTGDMVWNRRTDARFYRIADGQAVEREQVHGHRLVPNDDRDWLVVRGAHEALVPRRLFELVQQKIRARARRQRCTQPGEPAARGEPHRPFYRWHGQRARFVLSGLLICAHCGWRYQGVTRTKGRRRIDGTRVKTYSYVCGGYARSGTSVCRPGTVPKETLESAITERVLAYYQPYLTDGGRERLARAVRDQLGTEAEELGAARRRLEQEQQELKRKIDQLLDNLTETNREFVDARLDELKGRRQELEARQGQLEQMELAQQGVQTSVRDAMEQIEAQELALRQGLAEEKVAVLRQCLSRIELDAERQRVTLALRPVPLGDFAATEKVAYPLVDAVAADR